MAAPLLPVSILDLHLAVVSGKPGQSEGDAFSLAAPVVYGTAFAIAPGIFVTAAHVLDDARADSKDVAFARVRPDGVRVYLATDAEVFRGIDLAVIACPGFKDVTSIPIDFDHRLTMFDEVVSVGFPFSIDPEFLTWVQACRSVRTRAGGANRCSSDLMAGTRYLCFRMYRTRFFGHTFTLRGMT